MSSFVYRVIFIYLLLFSTMLNAALSDSYMITTWELNTTESLTFKLPIHKKFKNGSDFTVYWDYPVNNEYTNYKYSDNNADNADFNYPEHTYSKTGTYKIAVVPEIFKNLVFNYEFTVEDNIEQLVEFNQWGNIGLESVGGGFNNAINMSYKADDNPDLSNSKIESLSGAFRNIKSLEGDISGWNTQYIKNMSGVFSGVNDFNQNLNSWDVSNVKDFSSMFTNSKNTNPNISNWNTSSAENFSFMFYGAKNFNQNISGWNIGNALNMQSMFQNSSFNQNLSSWNIEKANNLQYIFSHSIISWENLKSTLQKWGTFQKKSDDSVIIDIGQKCVNKESKLSCDTQDIEDYKKVEFIDYSYEDTAPLIKSFIDNQWIVYENGKAFITPEIREIKAFNLIEDFEDYEKVIHLKQEITNDRNDTREVNYSAEILEGNETVEYSYDDFKRVLTIISKKDMFGSIKFLFSATDGYFTHSRVLDINVTNVDDIQIFEDIEDIDDVIEDDSKIISFTLNVTDIDSQITYESRSLDESIASVSVDETGKVIVTPMPNAYGIVRIEIKSVANGRVVKKYFNVTIKNQQDTPSIDTSSLSNLTIDEDSGIHNFDVNISDLDGDDINLTITSSNPNILIVNSEYKDVISKDKWDDKKLGFSLKTIKDANGEVTITLKVSDGISSSTKSFTINVKSIYDPLTIDSQNDKTYYKNFKDKTVTLGVNDSDVTGDLDYIIRYDTDSIQLSREKNILTIKSVQDFVGRVDINISAKDVDNNYDANVSFFIDIISLSADDDSLLLGEVVNDENSTLLLFENNLSLKKSFEAKIASFTLNSTQNKKTVMSSNLDLATLNFTSKGAEIIFEKDNTKVSSEMTMVANTHNTLVVDGKKQEIFSLKDETTTMITKVKNLIQVKIDYITNLFSITAIISEDGTLQHSVKRDGLTSRSITSIDNAITRILDNNSVESSVKRVNGDGSITEAIVRTDNQAKSKTEFVHHNKTSPYVQALLQNSSFDKGSLSEIIIYDNTLFIKTTTVLNNSLTIN
ncbi:MAG: hypothetical protein DRG78_13215 [Epsilonproteobacteria bacterium]|nr:MAG: hypothetical protein DRG78_13215 [Campylobacterota bacterium]